MVARPSSESPTPGSRQGFTLVELMIVIVILGILATIVIPQFSNASRQTRENALKDDLRYLRLQVQLFKAQHRDVPPGYPNGDESASPSDNDFVQQISHFSAEDCSTNDSQSNTYKFGPYLSRTPVNPINSQTAIYVVANGAAMPNVASLPVMNGSIPFGWVYKPQTQEWMANLAESDNNGTPFSSY